MDCLPPVVLQEQVNVELVWFCMVPYVLVWLIIIPYGPVWSFMVPYDPLWSCMVFEILSSPIALLSPVRYQILADIESFAFLFLFECISTVTPG